MQARSELAKSEPDPAAQPQVILSTVLAAAPVRERDLLARVMAVSPVSLILSGRDGRIILANRRAEHLFGFAGGELSGLPVATLLPARSRARAGQVRAPLASGWPRHAIGESARLLVARKDGTEFPAEIECTELDMDGTPELLAGIADLSTRLADAQRGRELERSNTQLEQSNAALEQSNSDLQDFAYAASHDLKAPLRAISHLVQWISEDIGAAATPQTTEYLRLLRGRVVRLQTLLEGLLAYARVRHADTVAEQVDLTSLMNEVVGMLSAPPGFSISVDMQPTTLHTYRVPLQIVLENLIGNAVKHHHRVSGTIEVAMRLRDQVPEFRIRDDGPGIAPEFRERIFEMFQTLASRDDVEASGIGLAIVRKKVQANGGRVWVEDNAPNRGSAFVFTWPEANPCQATP